MISQIVKVAFHYLSKEIVKSVVVLQIKYHKRTLVLVLVVMLHNPLAILGLM